MIKLYNLNNRTAYKLQTNMDKQALIEGIKEPLRLLVLAVIPFAIAYFGSLSYEWAGIIVVALRLIDSVMHEVGKEANMEQLSKGLTRF